MAPNGARRILFLLIQTLPTFWATWILILRIFIFWIFWDPKFPDFQVPDPRFFGPGLGLAWAWAWARAGALAWARAWAQTPPAPAPDELSDPNLTPLPTHPGIKYVARTLAATNKDLLNVPILDAALLLVPCDVFDPWVQWERGRVRLGSESSSGGAGAGGVRKSGNPNTSKKSIFQDENPSCPKCWQCPN